MTFVRDEENGNNGHHAGGGIDSEDFAHVSPTRYDHINPYIRYQIQVDRWAGKRPLRPINL
jgi:hypothetical protein